MKYRTRLTYANTLSFTTGTVGTCGTEVLFCVNSLYDPNFTGTGHQPNGFAQLSALYGSYQVVACEVTARFSLASVDMLAIVGTRAVGSPSSSGVTSDFVCEYANYASRVLTNNGVNSQIEFKVSVPPWIPMGYTKQQYLFDRGNTGSTISTNPSAQSYFVLNVGSLNGTSGQTCAAQVVMLFTADFYDLKTQTYS